MNGDRFSLLADEFLRPLNVAADCVFVAGFAYGSKQLAGFAWRALKGMRAYFVPLGRRSRRDLSKEFGQWAVVTAATSGIGLAFAQEFARRGMNVILISRAYDDLVSIVSDLQATYNVQVCGLHVDFTLGQHVFQEIEEALEGLEIGILVNNVAVNYDHPQYFALVPTQRLWELMSVNAAAPTLLTHMLLPQMLRRERGAVINVCSSAACMPSIPLRSAYTATTAFVDNFSQCLYHENRHRDVVIQTLLPGYVATDKVKPTLFTPTPQTYVRHALSTLGVASRTCGYWPHALQSWLCGLIPAGLWTRGTCYLNRIQRKHCLARAREDGHPLFLRKRSSNASAAGVTPTRRVSELSLRQSPGQLRRTTMAESPRFNPPSPVKRFTHDPLRRVSLEEAEGLRLSRSSSGASSLESVPESSGVLGEPVAAMFVGGPRADEHGSLGMGNGAMPRRAVSASSVELAPRRSPFLKKYSRVLVVPSVAVYSYRGPERPSESSPTYNPTDPINST